MIVLQGHVHHGAKEVVPTDAGSPGSGDDDCGPHGVPCLVTASGNLQPLEDYRDRAGDEDHANFESKLD